ncbi:uncharacterized protein EDB91DRAFT_1083293 [Suillus paluster]|uniref:uncharacterized protein n=1 Tax=Suillus paluster TaxID=48578 RepID=UPI001B871B08|nr:uncharacterized protein EDB91DRAFT_1083293 [Suillus paluster]KAG1736623.1 hypothetical protein EDB91DRAFT_1083293 [Suillus paluster]
MHHNHPKLHKLRKCTSLEWVYDSHENSDDMNDSRMVIHVGEEYELFVYELAVPMQDGSLPVMSYWYGKDVWLEIQWYYRKVDLEDEGVDLVSCIGEYELVLSDHISVIDMSCVEDHATILPFNEGDLAQPQIPLRTLEHDFCGALQGCGQGEDIEFLFNAVDGCIKAPKDQISTMAAVDAPDSAHSPTQMTLVSNNMDVPLEDFIANGLLVTARSTDKFLELFGMAEMMNRCQELLVDCGAMARFFTTAGKALYISQKGRDFVVQYDEEYITDAGALQDITPHLWHAAFNASLVWWWPPLVSNKDIHSQDDQDVDDSSDWVSVTLSMPMDMGWEDYVC